MFLIQYWITIGWAKLQRKWRKWLKTKEQLEQEARLRLTVEKFLKQLRANTPRNGSTNDDLPKRVSGSGEGENNGS